MSLRICLAVVFLHLSTMAAMADERPLAFGVLNQRSVALTAQYWNPILAYLSKKSGVPLELKMGKTAQDTTAMTVRGEFAFVYTNHLFTPERDRLGYQVIARFDSPPIRSVIVVRADSTIRALRELAGKDVLFPSPEAFVGYRVPMNALLAAGIKVTPRFAGNQEGAMAQLAVGAAPVAAVNELVLQNYARREDLRYRVLWKSAPYLNLPVMANPAIPRSVVEAVRKAMVGMARDAEGKHILEKGAELLKSEDPIGFVAADDHDYDNYRQFYKTALMQEP